MTKFTVLAVCAAALLSACSPAAKGPQVGPDGRPLPQVYKMSKADIKEIPYRVVDSVNTLRAARGVQQLQLNSALSDANIDAEVNRYISWPGQALGYKLGEIKIRELRARAEQQLGPKFDLRRFHDAVLSQGAVPLTVLESQIDGWIAAEKAR